ncbi:MAG: hypothetical protein KGL39_37515, partial [Patescibacteria group bacterium]|nr:hypothetical protein [Patescibacteria group bacterium]
LQSLYDNFELDYSFSQLSASEDTLSWLLAFDGKPQLCLVNTYSELPPIAHCPMQKRDVHLQPTGAYVQEVVSVCSEPRYVVSAGQEADIFSAGGNQWTHTPSLYSCPGWVISSHKHLVTGFEDNTFTVRQNGITYAHLSPWHGYFCVLYPAGCLGPTNLETEAGEHHMCCAKSGDLVYKWSPFTGAQWAFTAQITAGLTFAGGWSKPSLAIDNRSRVELRAMHVNQGGGDPLASGAYRLWSDDDGRSWGPITGGLLAPELVY